MTTQRIVRTTALANEVKALHDYRCQICGLRLETPGGPYAEGAHIRALGRPDGGPDVRENILCLCPNHHVLFDKGALVIRDDLGVLSVVTGSVVGTLRTDARHPIDPAHVAHHRARRLPGAAASD